MTQVRIPGDAVDFAAQDVSAPLVQLLQDVSLLATDADLEKAGTAKAAFSGPPQSVAVIEAGATAFAKWWAAGLGAAAAAAWAAATNFYKSNGTTTQRVVLWGAAIVIAALILALGYIVSTDTRDARTRPLRSPAPTPKSPVALLKVAQGKPDEGSATIAPLPSTMAVKYTKKSGSDEAGWNAIAMKTNADAAKFEYLVVKAGEQHWATADEVIFTD